MKLADIIALAKSGYTVAEIKELLALETEPTEPPHDGKPEDKPKEEPPHDGKPEDKPKEEPEDKTDYKALYEESQAKLKEAQKSNRNADNSDPNTKTDAEVIADAIIKMF